jgi:hypothetical protein
MTRVTLRPAVEFDAPSPGPVRAASKAHDKCFIANSVKTEVVINRVDHAVQLTEKSRSRTESLLWLSRPEVRNAL